MIEVTLITDSQQQKSFISFVLKHFKKKTPTWGCTRGTCSASHSSTVLILPSLNPGQCIAESGSTITVLGLLSLCV
ncbi:hypothetical protein K1719_030572 [Acacia pycnantha]|nr:hypothetical protein K1719_030572 [Acacia pycnantha]